MSLLANSFEKLRTLCLHHAGALERTASVFGRNTPLKSHQLLDSIVAGDGRGYRSMPTHGIGRYSHLIPKDTYAAKQSTSKKKKEKEKLLKMKVNKENTETVYGVVNLTVSGYDMPLVSRYTQYAHHLCNRLHVKVEQSYALPTKTTELLLMKEQSTKMFADAVLKTHRRVLQITDLSATLCPLLLEVLIRNQPEGVDFQLKEHTEADYLSRFKTRPELEDLVAKLSN